MMIAIIVGVNPRYSLSPLDLSYIIISIAMHHKHAKE